MRVSMGLKQLESYSGVQWTIAGINTRRSSRKKQLSDRMVGLGLFGYGDLSCFTILELKQWKENLNKGFLNTINLIRSSITNKYAHRTLTKLM